MSLLHRAPGVAIWKYWLTLAVDMGFETGCPEQGTSGLTDFLFFCRATDEPAALYMLSEHSTSELRPQSTVLQ
jgi:hypothetical protein